MRFWGGTATAAVALLASATAHAGACSPLASTLSSDRLPQIAASLIPVVAFGKNSRRTPETFAADHKIDPVELRHSHAASGLIVCGDAHGAGQLTLSANVVTTAAHVFFDENGIPRAPSCTFEMTTDGKVTNVPIDLNSIVAGSTNPYAVEPAHDWAVARLTRRVDGVQPYGLAANIHANLPVTFIARGHIDWGDAKKLSFEECVMHDQLAMAREGTREFSFDCETGDGASGGALMVDKERREIGGILVGWRSNRPFSAVPFSRTPLQFRGDARRRLPQRGGRRRCQPHGAEVAAHTAAPRPRKLSRAAASVLVERASRASRS